jgi:hypothetical protein
MEQVIRPHLFAGVVLWARWHVHAVCDWQPLAPEWWVEGAQMVLLSAGVGRHCRPKEGLFHGVVVAPTGAGIREFQGGASFAPVALCQCAKGGVHATRHALKHQLPQLLGCAVQALSHLPPWRDLCLASWDRRRLPAPNTGHPLPHVWPATPCPACTAPHPTSWLSISHLQMPPCDEGSL